MKRKRGAPLGNQNAFKHGFYAAGFDPGELQNLHDHASPDLVDEIGLVRVATARFLASLEANPGPRDIETEMSILRVVSLGASSVSGLVCTRMLGARGGPGVSRILSSLQRLAAWETDTQDRTCPEAPAD